MLHQPKNFTIEMTDNELVGKLRQDDQVAFKLIFNKYYSRLLYFVLEFIPMHDLAENIVQDTFITLWNKRNELNDTTCFSAYLYTVAKHNCLYRLREIKYQKKLFREMYLTDDEIDLNVNVLNSTDTSVFTFDEIQQIIQQTLESLPPQCKKVFMLKLADKRNKEIAAELQISVKVVEKHITRGLKSFRLALKDYLPLITYLFS